MFVMTKIKSMTVASVLVIAAGCAANKPPETTHDGLELVPGTKASEVYRKPGASLKGYKEFGLVPCQVAFKQNWLRSQNDNRMDLTDRVTQKDVDRIKDALSAECDKYFRAALEESPPYNLVEEFEDGEQVLIIQPAIVDLDINAPDTRTAGRSRSYTTSSGEMTLVLEMRDATTGETLVRAMDRRRAPDMGYLQWTSSVSNKADADRSLKRWSSQMREALDTATGL